MRVVEFLGVVVCFVRDFGVGLAPLGLESSLLKMADMAAPQSVWCILASFVYVFRYRFLHRFVKRCCINFGALLVPFGVRFGTIGSISDPF